LQVREVRLALVGCGTMGQAVHLPNFLASEKCQLVAVAHLREKLAQQIAAHYRIPKAYRSHEEVAADPDIEAVAAITLWTETPRVAVDLLRAGKHVFVEKPMALTLAEAEQMVEAARQAGRLLMVAYPLRFDAGVQRAKELVDELRATGELGRPIWAHAQLIGGDWTAGYFESAPPMFRCDEPLPRTPCTVPDFVPPQLREKYVFFAQSYAHNINLVRLMLGDELEVRFADFCRPTCSMVLDTGSYQASLHFGLVMPRPPWWDESITITFEKGWLRVETPPRLLPNVSARVTLFRGDRNQTIVEHGPWEWAFRREVEHFLECVSTSRETLSPGADAVKDVALTEAIFCEYLQTNQRIRHLASDE